MSCFWTLLFLTLAFGTNCLEAKHHKTSSSSSAVVVGTVFCDTCFQQDIPKAIHFIQGASVAVECKDTNFRQQVKTNIHGQFKVGLPFRVSKHLRKIQACTVKLISSNQPYCAIAATASASSTLRLKARKRGTHIYSAGFFTFKPSNKPTVCDQKPSIHTDLGSDGKMPPISNPNDPAFSPPLQDPPPYDDPPAVGRLLPPLPELPRLPPLPQLPPLPRIPFLPPEKTDTAKPSQLSGSNSANQPDSFAFPPNPFNPPSILPPNPFQPPPSLIPPVFPTPPPPIFPPLPPIPGLTPSPSPPPPTFPIPLPQFPFQPAPGVPGPGVPPAEVASSP